MILAWRRWRGSTKSVSLSLCQWRSAQRQHQVKGEKGRATRAIDYSRNFGMRLRLERSVAQETTFRWTVGEWWRSAQKVQSITYRCPLQVNRVAHLSSTRPVVARMPQSQQTPNDDTVPRPRYHRHQNRKGHPHRTNSRTKFLDHPSLRLVITVAGVNRKRSPGGSSPSPSVSISILPTISYCFPLPPPPHDVDGPLCPQSSQSGPGPT